MSDWHKESAWGPAGDLICGPSPVRDDCLMNVKGVPNPGRGGKHLRGLKLELKLSPRGKSERSCAQSVHFHTELTGGFPT